MASKLLVLALAAFGTASVLPREPEPENPGFLAFPITHVPRRLKRLGKRDADATLYNISGVSYLIDLGFGTPAQQVKVAIDTGSNELWVNPDCNDDTLTSDQATECVQDGSYSPSKSSTSNATTATNQIEYGEGEVDITYYFDDITIEGTSSKMSSVQFGVATASQELNEGILGLGFGNGKNLDYNNFVDELPIQGIAASKAFSVALGNLDSNNGGVIIFGGVDTQKFTGTLVENPILAPQDGDDVFRYWVQMTAVGLTKSGSSKTYTGGDTPVVLDSGTSLCYLPSEVMTSMVSDLGAQYDSSQDLYLLSCSVLSQSGAIDFAFGDVTIQVPFAEFILNLGDDVCALGALPADSSSGITALLGDSFLRSAYVVFDQTTNTLSMAQFSDCGTAVQAIPSSGAAGVASTCSGSSSSSKNAGERSVPHASISLVVAAVIGFLYMTLS